MPEQRLFWPIAQLCRLSGEDVDIILAAKTDTNVAGKFACIGLLVMAIFAISVYSSVHFLIHLLTDSHFIAITIGLFWGAMIANIYYLLLFTITPPILKGREWAVHGIRKEETTEKKALSRVSLLFRLLFVLLLAMVIAQPWLVTLFDTSQWIDRSRQEYRKEFIRLSDSATLSQDSLDITGQRASNRHRIDHLLSVNNFYTRKIQLINSQYPLSWLVTFIVVLLFIIPIGLKYHIRSKSNFYERKKALEEHIVCERYEDFKERYVATFSTRYGISTTWYESCTDPPFNTRKKEEKQEHADQQELLARIYDNEEDSETNKYTVRETIS
ncbi:MAG TPA: DUF4407 domain-containing protein [Puia sp.]